MKLEQLEIQNHRSVKNQCGEEAIEFEGLDCLVGKNNVGKTNIISSIRYLLEKEEKSMDEELYWNKDTSLAVEVSGYFEVTEEDLERISDEDERGQIREILLNSSDFDGYLGVCRRTGPEDQGGGATFRLIQPRPADERLDEDQFLEFRDEQWDNKSDGSEDFTANDYRDAMVERYPEISAHVEDGKLAQKRAWKDGYDSYIGSNPDDIEFELKPTSFPAGIKSTVKDDLLPDVIKIPAIKQVEDATRASGELGEMTDELYSEFEEDLNTRLDEQLSGVYDLLDTNSASFEAHISSYLKETFSGYSISLDFPRIESQRLFRDVGIRIEDEQLEDTLSHENVGEGMRRILIFSMLRTIADLRDGSLSVTDTEDEANETRQPLLILYEEAELFLHPNLQKMLLRVFENLRDSGAQIIFNTHSPVLVQNQVLDTVNIVRKNSADASEVTQFHTVLNKRDLGEISRLMDLQKVSSYIFSETAILVEGVSDALILKKMSTRLNSDWEFESQGIPVLPVEGKGNFPLFRDFLEELGINVFVMADIGALRRAVPRMLGGGPPTEDIDDLRETAESLVEDEEVEHRWTKSNISKMVGRYDWDETFDKFKDLEERLEAGEGYNEEHIECIKKLNNKRSQEAWRSGVTSDHTRINDKRLVLRANLIEEGIFVLAGEIEDYYPDTEASNKIEAAIEFSGESYSPEELREQFVEIADDKTDVEAFLQRVFQT